MQTTVQLTERIGTYSVAVKLNNQPCHLSVNGFAALPTNIMLGTNTFEAVTGNGRRTSENASQLAGIDTYLVDGKDYIKNLIANTVNTLSYFSNYTDF